MHKIHKLDLYSDSAYSLYITAKCTQSFHRTLTVKKKFQSMCSPSAQPEATISIFEIKIMHQPVFIELKAES